MKIKELKLSKITKLSLLTVFLSNSLLYCMDNEMNTQNNINKQNNFLGKKTKGEHKKEDIEIIYKNDEKIEKFHHNVSFHPSELISEIEFFNNEFEFNVKYGQKIVNDENIDKFKNCANFKYYEFVAANSKLKQIIKNESKNIDIQNIQINKYYTILNNLNNKRKLLQSTKYKML